MKNNTETSIIFKPGLTLLALMLAISSPVMAAGIYKWVDEEGKTHYGSERPENTAAEKMKLHVPEPASKPAPQEETEEAPEGKKTEETKLKDGGDQEKAKKERTAYCANERKRLKTAESSKEVHQKDASGNIVKMSSAARTQSINKIKANISQYCK
ncbi:MAG: DUF4124 domain-containing protein [Gammaproteobacteria bacterium]|nr:DUF4124 domain-containing protein [Gammaproteobacteria bacterium]